MLDLIMKALVLEKDKSIVYKEVPKPEKRSPDEVLVRVKASGICSSDIGRGFGGKAYHYPLIMGHEFSGFAEEVPPSARTEMKKGDRVVVFPLVPCKKCIPCQTGDYAQCLNYTYFGSRMDGGFAEYVWVPSENLFLIPDHVDTVHAAMTEPCAVALHGVRRMIIQPGMSGAVFGAGPIGNMVAQWLRIGGCHEVVLVDIDKRKLSIADEMGFTVIDSSETDPVQSIMDKTDGYGVDCVVEACGLPATFLQALQSAGRFAQVVFLGNIHGEFVIGEKDFSSVLRRELTIRGTWNSKITPRGKDDWSTVLSLMDRDLVVGPLISHTPPLKEGEAVFQKIMDISTYTSKVIFKV